MEKKIANQGSAKTPKSTMSKPAPAPAVKPPHGVKDHGWSKGSK
jgi:hypothetical protein